MDTLTIIAIVLILLIIILTIVYYLFHSDNNSCNNKSPWDKSGSGYTKELSLIKDIENFISKLSSSMIDSSIDGSSSTSRKRSGLIAGIARVIMCNYTYEQYSKITESSHNQLFLNVLNRINKRK